MLPPACPYQHLARFLMLALSLGCLGKIWLRRPLCALTAPPEMSCNTSTLARYLTASIQLASHLEFVTVAISSSKADPLSSLPPLRARACNILGQVIRNLAASKITEECQKKETYLSAPFRICQRSAKPGFWAIFTVFRS